MFLLKKLSYFLWLEMLLILSGTACLACLILPEERWISALGAMSLPVFATLFMARLIRRSFCQPSQSTTIPTEEPSPDNPNEPSSINKDLLNNLSHKEKDQVIAKLSTKMERMTSALEKSHEQITQLEYDLEAQESALKRSELIRSREKVIYSQQSTEQRHQLTELVDELSDRSITINHLQEENQQIRTQLTEQQQDRERQETEIRKHQGMVEQNQRLTTMVRELRATQSEHLSLQQELENELDCIRQQYQQLEDLYEQERESTVVTNRRTSELFARILQLQAAYEQLRCENHSLRTQSTELESRYQELVQELSLETQRLNQANEKWKRERDASAVAEQIVNTHFQRILYLQKLLEDNTAENNKLQILLDASLVMDEKNQAKLGRIDELENDLTLMQKTLSDKEEHCEQLEMELVDILNRLVATKEQLKQTNEQTSKFESDHKVREASLLDSIESLQQCVCTTWRMPEYQQFRIRKANGHSSGFRITDVVYPGPTLTEFVTEPSHQILALVNGYNHEELNNEEPGETEAESTEKTESDKSTLEDDSTDPPKWIKESTSDKESGYCMGMPSK